MEITNGTLVPETTAPARQSCSTSRLVLVRRKAGVRRMAAVSSTFPGTQVTSHTASGTGDVTGSLARVTSQSHSGTRDATCFLMWYR